MINFVIAGAVIGTVLGLQHRFPRSLNERWHIYGALVSLIVLGIAVGWMKAGAFFGLWMVGYMVSAPSDAHSMIKTPDSEHGRKLPQSSEPVDTPIEDLQFDGGTGLSIDDAVIITEVPFGSLPFAEHIYISR